MAMSAVLRNPAAPIQRFSTPGKPTPALRASCPQLSGMLNQLAQAEQQPTRQGHQRSRTPFSLAQIEANIFQPSSATLRAAGIQTNTHVSKPRHKRTRSFTGGLKRKSPSMPAFAVRQSTPTSATSATFSSAAVRPRVGQSDLRLQAPVALQHPKIKKRKPSPVPRKASKPVKMPFAGCSGATSSLKAVVKANTKKAVAVPVPASFTGPSSKQRRNRAEFLARVMGEMLTKLCDYNHEQKENKPLIDGKQVPPEFALFNACSIYKNLPQFLVRLYQEARFHETCFVTAFMLINRLHNHKSFVLTWYNVHRIILIAVLLADKIVDDHHENNDFYSRVSGLKLRAIVRMEAKFLRAIDFNCFLLWDQYMQTEAWLDNFPKKMPGSSFPHFC